MNGALYRGALDDSINTRAVNPASKREHVASLGAKDDVLLIDGALQTTGLIGPLEMTRKSAAILF